MKNFCQTQQISNICQQMLLFSVQRKITRHYKLQNFKNISTYAMGILSFWVVTSFTDMNTYF